MQIVILYILKNAHQSVKADAAFLFRYLVAGIDIRTYVYICT